MYTLRKIELNNFGSFRETHTIVIPRGMTFVTGKNMDSDGKLGSNGAGKTTIANAIVWGLWGDCPAGALGAVRSHGRTVVSTRITLQDPQEGITLTVHRKMTNNKHELSFVKTQGGKPETFEGHIPVVQNTINQILGCDYGMFTSVLYFRGMNGVTQFLQMLPGKRAQVLSNLVDDELFQIGADILKNRLAEMTNQNGCDAAEAMTRKHNLTVSQGDLAKAEAELKHWNDTEMDRQKSAQKMYQAGMAQLTQLSKELMETREYCKNNTVANIGAEHTRVSSLVRELEGDVRSLERDMSRISSRAYLESHKEACPTCGQAIGELSLLQQDAKRTQLSVEMLGKKKQLEAQKRVLEEVTRKLEVATKSVSQVTLLEQRIEDSHSNTLLWKDATVRREDKYLQDRIVELRARLQEDQARIVALEDRIVATNQDIATAQAVRNAFAGPVRNLMFDLIRGPLEEWSQYYIDLLLDTGVTIRFPHQAVKEKFEIHIWNGQYCQDLSAYSGGELWRLSIAILLAFRKVLAEQQQCRLNFILMDDFAGELDAEGIQVALRVLQRLTDTEVETILMTIPREEFLPTGAYNRLGVIMQGGTSRCCN